jgi:hypothetical protein
MFAEAFRTEVSTAANSGRSGRFADPHVYDRRPGQVSRCPHCGQVNAGMVRTPSKHAAGTARLDLLADPRIAAEVTTTHSTGHVAFLGSHRFTVTIGPGRI